MSMMLASVATATTAKPHNLLLITIDTLRADYLSCNGSTVVRTPHLDRLAAGGVNFTRARAPVPLTLPSHASILTGNYPPTHTLRDNGPAALPPEQETLAERLRPRGYQTAAFVASFVLDRRFGLAQGFDVYDDKTWSDISMLERLDAERSGDEVLTSFQRWLESSTPTDPFFAWIHLFDPHAPYAPPEPFLRLHPENPYAGEVAYVDHVVGRLVDDLKVRDVLNRTIVAVVGDHGEGLGDHGERTHGLLIHNSTLHVPMILYAPGLIGSNLSVPDLVRTIDLGATLLDYLGVGQDLGEGVSLRGLIDSAKVSGPQASTELTAYSESLYPRLHLGWSEQRGLEVERYRLVLTPQPAVFDIGTDPDEQTDIAPTRRDLVRALRRRLDTLTAGFPAASSSDDSVLDAQAVARLRALGYLSGSPAPRYETPVDPKSKLEVWDDIELAMSLFGHHDYAAAASRFEKVIESETDMPLLYEYLGSSYMRLERWDEAEAVYRRALTRGIESSAMHVAMGRILERRGQRTQAQREFEAALEIDAQHVDALSRLGDLHRASRRFSTAIEQYRRALEINRDYVYAWNGLGIALATAGRPEEALTAFRQALDVQPDAPLAHLNLALQLERMGAPLEAAVEFESFLRLAPDDGSLSAERLRAEEAIRRLNAPSH
ncbi:MAG: sulfatase-like hydrolase/transferase [Acidobacteriota bacterium]|nr:sulfatase-like hydrolase/transferase [Acidobacteriota bacterium]